MKKFPKFLRVLVSSKTKEEVVNGTIVSKIIFDETMVKFTEVLAQALMFSFKLLPAGKIEIGRELEGGNWTGMVGMVQRNETDMVISTLSVSDQRLKVADFSYPYNRVRLTFATRKPAYTPDIKSFLMPFAFEVWILTLVYLFLLPATFYVLFEKRRSFGKLVFAAYSSLVHQDMCVEPRKTREYLLLIFWQIGVCFLIFCYTALLLSFITFPPLSGIRTIPELAAAVQKGKYQCTCYPGSFLVRILSKSPDPKDQIIGNNLLQNKGSRDIEKILSNTKSKRKPAFLGGEDDFLPLSLKYFVSEDEFIPALRSVALTKGFCCRPQLDRVIGRVWASGIFQKLKEHYMFLDSLRVIFKSLDELREKENPLAMEDLQGAFFVLISGNILATLTFFGELLISKKSVRAKIRFITKRKRRSKRSKLIKLDMWKKQFYY